MALFLIDKNMPEVIKRIFYYVVKMYRHLSPSFSQVPVPCQSSHAPQSQAPGNALSPEAASQQHRGICPAWCWRSRGWGSCYNHLRF